MLRTVRVLSQQGPVRVELARMNERLVVVKRLFGFNPALELRLRREAEVARKLDHPGIVPLLEVRDGALIYPYAPGIDLAEALDAGPLPLARVHRVVQDVLEALCYAHGLGIIHCDVKPGNILVRGERARLTDFGFAKDLGLQAITATETMLGTPNYMAPEQFQGVRTDPRSDLYGLAAVVYHAVTGGPPYGRRVLQVLVGDADLPLDPLPPEAKHLEAWVRRGLARDPAERFPDAESMLADLPALPLRA